MAQAEPAHLFQVSDLFRIEQLGGDNQFLGGPTFSPDGHSCIFEHLRPLNSVSDVPCTATWTGLSRSDLWLVCDGDIKPRNLTEGENDGSGSWKSYWSPDSQRVAFYSTRGTAGENLRPRLCLWENASGQIRQLSDRTPYFFGNAVWWMGPTRLLCVGLSDPEWIGVDSSLRMTRLVPRLWSNIWSGKIATVSVIESGITNAAKTNNPFGVLSAIDTVTSKETIVDEGLFFGTVVSPDGSRALVTKDFDRNQTMQGDINKDWKQEKLTGSIEIVMSEGQLLSTPHLCAAATPVYANPVWSPDSRRLAFVEVQQGKESTNCALMIYDPATDQVLPVPCRDIEVSWTNKIYWMAGDSLILQGKAVHAVATNSNRADWWLVSAGAASKNLTAQFTNTVDVADFFRVTGTDQFMCRAEEAVWRIDADTQSRLKLTATITNSIENVIFAADRYKNEVFKKIQSDAGQCVVVTTKNGTTNNYFWLDLRTTDLRSIAKPSPDAEVADFAASTGTGMFVENGRTGSRIWREKLPEQGTATLLAEVSTFLADTVEAKMQLIEYRSLDGRSLKAWLLLPCGYKSGKRFPMVAWVYAGEEYTGSEEPLLGKLYGGQLLPFNFQLLAARGYVVLFPSMPLKPPFQSEDTLLELTQGVLPAVDKAIDLGIADPERIGVAGHSFGGFSTMGLLTQTRRFKAGIALAGLSDFISMYDTFGGSVRYRPDPNERGGDFGQLWSPGQGRLLNPPWMDLGHFTRNSPITYVDRVETPLLIIQGDMDYVPIQQGEEFFQALYKQGKRAEFARYWGEGHVFSSPANVEDMWNRIFNWFDTYLKDGKSKDSALSSIK